MLPDVLPASWQSSIHQGWPCNYAIGVSACRPSWKLLRQWLTKTGIAKLCLSGRALSEIPIDFVLMVPSFQYLMKKWNKKGVSGWMDGWKSSMPLTFKKLPNLTQIFIFRGGKGDKCTCDDSCNARTVTNAVSMTQKCIQSNSSSGQLQVDTGVYSF